MVERTFGWICQRFRESVRRLGECVCAGHVCVCVSACVRDMCVSVSACTLGACEAGVR